MSGNFAGFGADAVPTYIRRHYDAPEVSWRELGTPIEDDNAAAAKNAKQPKRQQQAAEEPKKPGHCCGYDGTVHDPSDPKPNHCKHNSTEPTPGPYSRNGSIFGFKPEGYVEKPNK